jgi:hypothetical protein
MRVTIRNWPPVASHLSCLFLGLFLSNLSRPVCEKAVLKKNIAFISVDKSFLENSAQLGDYLLALKRSASSSESFCYEKSNNKFRLVKKGEFITLEVKVSSLEYSSKVFADYKKYQLTPQQYIYDYKKCRNISQVHYGL